MKIENVEGNKCIIQLYVRYSYSNDGNAEKNIRFNKYKTE
jgi:hypothetical protein